MTKGKYYSYHDIEMFADGSYHMFEYGDEIIGKHFICLDHVEKDITISFVLTGATSINYIYECIYSDND